MPTSKSNSLAPSEYLHDLIKSARPFLRENLESVDKSLPKLLSILRSASAGECWHRLGTFHDHLYHVYRILKLWKAPDSVCLFGLLHSVYSNSYHDLAIFDPVKDREIVRNHVGDVAERLIPLQQEACEQKGDLGVCWFEGTDLVRRVRRVSRSLFPFV
ncbi:hypothetical protein CTI12_AA180360 [Artemisia annua]|uniref:DUF6817 domain-containing protein n=1 Tax=Artemisia annua TaxID=35608 RepID=A0A2U1P8W6_ARTAN|nr:hypothetical protein CTI12_AA180360 [Artemisia annua]